MSRATAEHTAVAVLAKAPLPGFAKTRLIPELGENGAAALQAELIKRAVVNAQAARLGPVVLWCAPHQNHPLFATMREAFGVTLACQPDADLGARMHAAFAAANGPVLVIGTDCPALTPVRLREAADALRDHDAVLIPAEDGGYVLVGLRRPSEALFSEMEWSTPTVMTETRTRLRSLKLSWRELPPLWDIDTPEDFARLRRENLLG
jgi:rSAM/selenodomain-associated transferase 1